MNADVVIVGSGHSGAQAATMLRQLGFEGSVLLVGAEPEPPYERPPLSKQFLAGTKTFDKILIRPKNYWTERNISLMPGTEVTDVDANGRQVRCALGENIHYRKLIWAAGGAPRRLGCKGSGLAGIHYIRTHADVVGVLSELPQSQRIVIIGGGYIGLEAAAVLITQGKTVTLVEVCDRILARVAGKDISHFYESEHRANGVDIRTGVGLEALTGHQRVSSVMLTDGTTIPADIVIAGIGVDPTVGPLIRAGAQAEHGVIVDEYCRTSLTDVYAIGDCAAHRNEFAGGELIRVESVQNANDQATTVAQSLTGNPSPYRATPWFWSDQYDLKLQTVGISRGYDQSVLRGEPQSRQFSVIYLKNGRVIALDCVNSIRDYSHGRRLVEVGATPDITELADTTRLLKTLL